MRIVADAAASKGESYTPQRRRVDAGHAQVNGLPLNVKAIFGDAWGTQDVDALGQSRGGVRCT